MSSVVHKIRQQLRNKLSLRLSLSILVFAFLIFVVTMTFLFQRTRSSVRQEGIELTTQLVNNTASNMMGILSEVEVATRNTEWLVLDRLDADSIFGMTRSILELNPDIDGCSISFEPYVFPKMGKYFSVYSYRDNRHIQTEQEGDEQFDYFTLPWYSVPKEKDESCWIDPFRDYNPSGFYARDPIASYCRPLHAADGRFIGVISTDISQRKLAENLSTELVYPHSYFMLIGQGGGIIASGSGDAKASDLDRSDCIVVRKPLASTGWTLAFICPESDFFRGYYLLIYLLISIVLFGLLLMLVICYLVVYRTVTPIRLLARQASKMAGGHFDGSLAPSSRIDEVGHLQNGFIVMQQTIAGYVADLEHVKQQTEQRNEELRIANDEAVRADRRKTAFIQDLYHQVRTPLNIISGFVEVLRDSHASLPEHELNVIMRDIQQNSHTISIIVDNWQRTLALEDIQNVELRDRLGCNEICRMAAAGVTLRHPGEVSLLSKTALPDELTILTDRDCLLKVLGELLHNANKHTRKGYIAISCRQTDAAHVCFSVSNTGTPIPVEDRERIFTQFAKLSEFNEGLGLGLPLCRRLVGLLGGTLELDTTFTSGARFLLTLSLPGETLPGETLTGETLTGETL